MDLMQIRRMLFAMGGGNMGADFVKGSFTVPNDGYTYIINIGKTFSKYLYYFEMTDDSKTALHNSGQTAARMFACIGAYPNAEFDEGSDTFGYYSVRVKPSDGTIDKSASASPSAMDGSSITIPISAISSGANAFYKGYTYNYYIVEIK